MLTYTETVRSSVRDILNVVFRHKGKTRLFFVAAVILAVLFAYVRPEIYQSEARILIRTGRENLTVAVPGNERSVTMVQDQAAMESQVNSELALITSTELVENLVDKFGEKTFLTLDYPPGQGRVHFLDVPRKILKLAKGAFKQGLVIADIAPMLTPKEKAVAEITRNLSAVPIKDSNVIVARLESENRRLAMDALQALVEDYMARHIALNATKTSPEFFEERALAKLAELEAAEKELEEFRKVNNITTIAQQQEVLMLQLKDLENEQGIIAAMAEGSAERIVKLEAALERTTPTIELSNTTGKHNYTLDPLKEQLLTLKVQEKETAGRYQDTYPPLVQLRQKIREAEEMVAEEDRTHTEITKGVNLNYQSILLELEKERAQLEDYRARRDVLAQKIEQRRKTLSDLAACEIRYEALQRARMLAEAEYKQYRENIHLATISNAFDEAGVSNVSLMQPATHPIKPIRPNKPLVVLMGILFGLLGGLGLAYLFEYFDDTFKADADVERYLKLPVLASVSESEFKSCT